MIPAIVGMLANAGGDEQVTRLAAVGGRLALGGGFLFAQLRVAKANTSANLATGRGIILL